MSDQASSSTASVVAEVTVEPLGETFSVRDGETVIEAAWREGYYWPTVCGGRGECSACWAQVLSGADHAPPPQPDEQRQLDRVRHKAGSQAVIRLACQLRPEGEVEVAKKGVRRRLR